VTASRGASRKNAWGPITRKGGRLEHRTDLKRKDVYTARSYVDYEGGNWAGEKKRATVEKVREGGTTATPKGKRERDFHPERDGAKRTRQ